MMKPTLILRMVFGTVAVLFLVVLAVLGASAALPAEAAIFYTSNRRGIEDVFTADILRGIHVNLTRSDTWNGSPARSPDGSRIAFSSRRDGNTEIYVMDVVGRNVERLTHSPARDIDPVWSPDGTQIAFNSDRAGNWEIYV